MSKEYIIGGQRVNSLVEGGPGSGRHPGGIVVSANTEDSQSANSASTDAHKASGKAFKDVNSRDGHEAAISAHQSATEAHTKAADTNTNTGYKEFHQKQALAHSALTTAHMAMLSNATH